MKQTVRVRSSEEATKATEPDASREVRTLVSDALRTQVNLAGGLRGDVDIQDCQRHHYFSVDSRVIVRISLVSFNTTGAWVGAWVNGRYHAF
jgi:hypothetical protein